LIDRQEVMDFPREFGLTPNVIKKDYVLGWTLAGISNHSELSRSCGVDLLFRGDYEVDIEVGDDGGPVHTALPYEAIECGKCGRRKAELDKFDSSD